MGKTTRKLKTYLAALAKKYTSVRFFAKIARTVYHKGHYFLYYLRFRKVEQQCILFESFKGKKYCDSPKALYETLTANKAYETYTFVWAIEKDAKTSIPNYYGNLLIVPYCSKEYFKYFSKAKYIVTNSRLPLHLIKKRAQTIVQTWHGTPFKRLGCDIAHSNYKSPYNTLKQVKAAYQKDGRDMDILLSPSRYCSEKFTSAFALDKIGKEDIILEEGYPRNDILSNYSEAQVEKIREKLNLPKDKKIILYAPTWRDNSYQAGVGYTYFSDTNFNLLREKLGKDYYILYRAHYFVAKSFHFEAYEGFIQDVSEINDINELYLVSDMLITDYSSVFFDYSILKRPILFYMYDISFYQDQLRGFYLNLEELPGPISETEEELIEHITNVEQIQKKWQKKLAFFHERFTYLEDGKASERVIKKIGF